jgi:hypothetical protein
MKRLLFRTVPALVLGVACVWGGVAPGQQADPYAITPEAGPWVICVTSYMGEEAPGLARQLVEQLRKDHRLPAYVYDRGDAERKEWEECLKKTTRPGRENVTRRLQYTQNCAVLIGGFKDMEAANAALPKVKALPAPDLKDSTGKKVQDYMFDVKPDDKGGGREMRRVAVNPYQNSFVARNPTTANQKAEAKPDPIWKDLNAAESYSLLKNPKPWTLVVKNYPGATVMQTREEKSSLWEHLTRLGRKPGDGITAAGYQAHQLAEFLRDKRVGGFDAYVLHTRTNSLVTIGEFDAPDDPQLEQLKRRLERLSFKADTRSPAGMAARGDPIGLMANPLPMQVPHF